MFCVNTNPRDTLVGAGHRACPPPTSMMPGPIRDDGLDQKQYWLGQAFRLSYWYGASEEDMIGETSTVRRMAPTPSGVAYDRSLPFTTGGDAWSSCHASGPKR